MDLIYSRLIEGELVDLGVIQDYTMDLAYGQSLDAENDFEIDMALETPQCQAGDYVYCEGTEYGGIIDSIGADMDDNMLIYKGRTWHGILASKVIEPSAGEAYYSVQGEANEVISEIIDRCGLSDVFKVSDEDSGITIELDENSQFRYDDVNVGVFDMLQANDAKLILECKRGGVELHVEPLMNYATEEFDSTQMNMEITQTFIHCNHLVCLGDGELENRRVIHLFCDEHGGVLPYVVDGVDVATKDEHYILDRREIVDPPEEYRLLLGMEEYEQVYDYPGAPVTENYELLTEEPEDWATNYTGYYEKEEPEEGEEVEDDSYTEIERRTEDKYILLTSKPDDWGSKVQSYYTKSYDPETDEDVYNEIEGTDTGAYKLLTKKPKKWSKRWSIYYIKVGNKYERVEKTKIYKRLTKRPKDWAKKYGNYYVTDGVDYLPVGGVSKNKYKLQTRKPSDWSTDWKNYYVKYKNPHTKKISHITLGNHPSLGKRKKAPKWKKNTYYTQDSKTVTPDFKKMGAVYSLKLKNPTWQTNTYYSHTPKYTETWAADTYYRLEQDVDIGLEFKADTYYKQVLDHYAELVAGGLERLKDINDLDELTVDFNEMEQVYDIGDIVGGDEEITGVYTAKPVLKKIVKIEHDVADIKYEVR